MAMLELLDDLRYKIIKSMDQNCFIGDVKKKNISIFFYLAQPEWEMIKNLRYYCKICLKNCERTYKFHKIIVWGGSKFKIRLSLEGIIRIWLKYRSKKL